MKKIICLVAGLLLTISPIAPSAAFAFQSKKPHDNAPSLPNPEPRRPSFDGPRSARQGEESCQDSYRKAKAIVNASPVKFVCDEPLHGKAEQKILETPAAKEALRRAGERKSTDDPGPHLHPLPKWCIELPGSGPMEERFDLCEIQTRVASVWKEENGKLILIGKATYMQKDYTTLDFGAAIVMQQEELVFISIDPSLHGGLAVSGTYSCLNPDDASDVEACKIHSAVSGFPYQPASVFNPPFGVADWGIPLDEGEVKDISGNIKRTISFPGAIPATRGYGMGYVRCDFAVPGAWTTGCVMKYVRPVMVYRLSGPYPELAGHIQRAQQSGLPGEYKEGDVFAPPLHRLTDKKLKKKNGDTACPPASRGGYPRPVGHDCDEYPFRSTYEGAYTGNPGYPDTQLAWPARTWDGCEINLDDNSHQDGPDGYSVCMIDSSQNQKGGDALSEFYISNRVIDEDAFYVWIVS